MAAGRQTPRYLVIGVRVASVGLILLVWQTLAGGPKSILPLDAVSRPTDIAVALYHLMSDGQLFSALGATALTVGYSMLLGAPIGLLLAGASLAPMTRWLLEPLVTITYAIPKIALISIYILVIGVRSPTRIANDVGVILFVFYFSGRQAFEEIDRGAHRALQLMGAGRLKMARSFWLRSAVPHLFAATRIALPLAFAVEIFAELRVPNSPGLGSLLNMFTTNLDPAGMMAVVLFVVVIGYSLDVLVGRRFRRYTASVGLGVS